VSYPGRGCAANTHDSYSVWLAGTTSASDIFDVARLCEAQRPQFFCQWVTGDRCHYIGSHDNAIGVNDN